MTYAEQNGISTGDDGWPVGITTEEKDRLIACVRSALEWGPLPLHELYSIANGRDALPAGRSLLDWLYACVDRAARSLPGCSQMYALPGTTNHMPWAVRRYGETLAVWRQEIDRVTAGDTHRARHLRLARAAHGEAARALTSTERADALAWYGSMPTDLVDAEKPPARDRRRAVRA